MRKQGCALRFAEYFIAVSGDLNALLDVDRNLRLDYTPEYAAKPPYVTGSTTPSTNADASASQRKSSGPRRSSTSPKRPIGVSEQVLSSLGARSERAVLIHQQTSVLICNEEAGSNGVYTYAYLGEVYCEPLSKV